MEDGTVDPTGEDADDGSLVSVIVPTHDRPRTLRRAVATVRAQSYRPIEVVVVDDASSEPAEDALSDVAAGDSFRIRHRRHEENRGASAARNTGIEAADGDLVAFLDDDDEWTRDKLARQVAAFHEADDVGVVYTGIRNVGPDGRPLSVRTPSIEGRVTDHLLRGNFVGSFSAVMVRERALEAAGPLDERFPAWQDWEYYIRLSQHCRFASIPEPLVVRHNVPGGQLSRSFAPKRDVSYPLLLEKYRPLARDRGLERQFVAYATYHLGRAALANGEYAAARRALARAVARYPLALPFYVYLLAAVGGGVAYPPLRTLKRRAVQFR